MSKEKLDGNKAKALLNQLKVLPEDDTVDIEEQRRLFFKEVRKVRKRKFYRYAAAAIFTGFILIGYLFKNEFKNPTGKSNNTVVENTINTGADKAILTLSNGIEITLEEGKLYQNDNANSNGLDITYTKSSESDEITFNTLTVPRGGKFNITLSDGTQVWLNSESQLRYPITFVDGKTRELELVYGEAYFDVSPSLENEGSTFKVLCSSQEIEVLGTEFNLNAYNLQKNIYTTLIEGKVSVTAGNNKKILTPSTQSKFNINSMDIAISKIDPYNATAWKEGIFSFDGENLDEIMKVLSRWYDFNIVFDNKNLKDIQYVGVFRKDQEFEDILLTLESFGIINSFTINKNKVILK